MNTLATDPVTSSIAVIEQAGVPALRIAFTLAAIIFLSIAIQTPKMMDQPSDTIVWRRSCLFGTV